MSTETLTVNRAWQFPNGVFVFHNDGTQIDPNSEEGLEIRSIYQYQVNIRQQNDEQRIQFAWDTFPRDTASRKALLSRWNLDPDSPAPTSNSSS